MPPVDESLTDSIPHGGSGGGYSNYGCRCAECKEANTRRVVARRRQREQEAKDPNDRRHGTMSFYINAGCRCDKCKECSKLYGRNRKR